MAHAEPNFGTVRKIIKFLEDANEGNKLTPKRLDLIQADLDEIDTKYKYDASIEHKRYELYELQSLIHYLRGDYEKAEHFALDAQDLKPEEASFVSKTIPVIISALNHVNSPSNISANTHPTSVVDFLKNKNDNEIVFYRRSPTYVAWMSFLSLNIYNLYWFYKQWRYIGLSTKERTFPILSSLFQLFTTFSLFKKISQAADDKNYPKSFDYGTYAALYVALLLGGKAVGNIDFSSAGMVWAYMIAALALSLVVALITAKMQAAANFSNDNFHSEFPAESKKLPGEILFGIITFLIFVVFLFATFGTLVNNTYPRGSDSEISEAGVYADDLTARYDKCSAELESANEILDKTDQIAIDGYNAQYDACESIRLEQNAAVERYNYLLGY